MMSRHTTTTPLRAMFVAENGNWKKYQADKRADSGDA
jgi:hypothetical protein